MNRKKFIQDNIAAILVSDLAMERPVDQRMDFAIAVAEKLWTRLCDRGYGDVAERGSTVAKKLGTKVQYSAKFEKAWQLYRIKIKGDKRRAYELWQILDDATHDWILYAIPRYVESVQAGQSPRHFNTFLSGELWESFPIKREAQSQDRPDTGEIIHLQKLIAETANTQTKERLQDQLDRLTKAVKL